MNQEPIIQSEVSQKSKYHINTHTHIYTESRKIVLMNRAGIGIQTQRTDL